ncbi:hypothetical protein, partial [Okeania sp. SIO2B9]|uniref:hypothetical protein n=1 Tax=Okeania sp. SIO2B9 TaxID=2607782 RepID=UPI00142B17B3
HGVIDQRAVEGLGVHDHTLINNTMKGAEFSTDLKAWVPAEEMIQDGPALHIYPPKGEYRYM